MATYGLSFYGVDKYGNSSRVKFDAAPVKADPVGYGRVSLTWRNPGGSWDLIRVLRNWTGFSADEIDGEILDESTGALSAAIDTGIRPGAWHYYTVWVRSGSDWYIAGSAATLMFSDHGYGERLLRSLPLYHQTTQGILDDRPAIENAALKKFLSVLAVGLNYIKTYYDSLLLLNDPMRNHLAQLVSLGEQFGVEYTPVTPSHLYRSHVRNAATLGRQKGTLEGLRSAISLTVGWDIEATPGKNLVLNEDAASFVHPVFPEWDPGINYAAGEKVAYGGFSYMAKTGGAYGEAQKPTGNTTSNTWWDWLNGYLDPTYASPDGSVAGWGPVSFTAGVSPGLLKIGIGNGTQSPTDPTVLAKNSLYMKNNTGVTADLGATSVAGADTDPVNAIKRGIPLPKADRLWDAVVEYEVGDLVLYKGLPYRARVVSKGSAPTGTTADNTAWSAMGVDSRVRVSGSLYISGGSLATNQDRLAYPVMEFFDDRGARIATVDTSQPHSNSVFDGFITSPGTMAGRITNAGAKTWGTIGTWQVSAEGFAYPLASQSFAYVDGQADGRVSATFHREAAGTATQAVAIRWVGADFATGSYLKATRTGLYSVSAGTATLLASYPQAFAEGDRITVSFVGSTIKVYRNGTLVLTQTSTVNQTAVRHGMLVA